jgi:hypothetical protein
MKNLEELQTWFFSIYVSMSLDRIVLPHLQIHEVSQHAVYREQKMIKAQKNISVVFQRY